MNCEPVFERFVDSGTQTQTYLVADPTTKECALFDTVKEHTALYVARVEELGLKLTHLFETHVHADHITGNALLRTRYPWVITLVSKNAKVSCAHVSLSDGDLVKVGSIPVIAFATPGHTSESLSFLVNGTRLLTGDTLLIDSCGRTDFQAGDANAMYASLHRLASLPDETLVYPAHDYNGRSVSTIGEQKRKNALLALSEDDFVKELASWNLPPPQKLDASVPANLTCGD